MNHPIEESLKRSVIRHFREAGHGDPEGERGSGEANIINGTGTKRFAVPMYPESGRERKKEEDRKRKRVAR